MTMTSATTGALVFEIYIKASPEQIWEAITGPEFRAKYFFGERYSCDQHVGGRLRSYGPDGETWGDNEILQWDPPKTFSHTWRSLYDPDLAGEPQSRVTWTIEPQDGPDAPRPGDYCKLTVVHDRLEGSPRTAESVKGWSWILSGLKTVVETGEPMVTQERSR
jgi:uncharacterized protein YndB with AHSA1/START domain